MTPTETLHKAKKDFQLVHTEAPMDECVRNCKIEVIQRTIRKLVDGLTGMVARRKFMVCRADYSKSMVSKEKNQEKVIAGCQTFLEKLAAKHDQLNTSHNALTCSTCQHRALTPVDSATAWQLQKGPNAQFAAYKAMLEARRICFMERAVEKWGQHCLHN